MKRTVAFFAVFGILAIPDWAAACWPHWCQPVCPPPFYAPPPMYTIPAGPPDYVSPVYPVSPVYGFTVPPPYPPSVETTPARNATIPKAAVPISPIAPSGNQTGAKQAGSQSPSAGGEGKAGEAKNANPGKSVVQPAAGGDLLLPKAPMGPGPSTSSGELPPLVLPKEPERKSAPKQPEPKSSTSSEGAKPLPNAKPSPAPADPIPTSSNSKSPIPNFNPAIPSAAPSDPLIPSAKSKPESLPSITLPPEVPVKPDSVSRSSPVTQAGGKVEVKRFPVTAATFTGGYRTVSFYNHTAKEIDLTVEGQAVKLPAKSYVETKLGPKFTWSYGGNEALTERLSAAAAGLDVVFRE